MKGAEGLRIFVVSAIIAVLFIHSALSEEVLLGMQQYISLGNCTLKIEDVDSKVGQVWLVIFAEQEPTQSAIVAVGETFCCCGRTLKVLRIYAGDDTDLVALEILSK